MKINLNPSVNSSDTAPIRAKNNGDGTCSPYVEVSPISFAKSTACTVVASPNVLLLPVKIIDANLNRIGLILYNNGANSAYFKYGSAGNAGTDMTFILATFSSWVMPQPIFTGAIYGQRNAGSGVVVATELVA